jgi:hypothetical protein
VCSAPHLAAQENTHPTYKGYSATLPKNDPKLSQDQSDAKYRTCPSAWYSGPQKGKVWYSKDAYLWVVTPAFAQRTCMPVEFVHEGLKGAEAVAFRLMRKTETVTCELKGSEEQCAGDLVFRVEVYIDSKIKLPKLHEARNFQIPRLPSSMLIGRTEADIAKAGSVYRNHPPDALSPIFKPGQVGISGYTDSKVVWPVLSLSADTYVRQTFVGIDYYSFDVPAQRVFANAGKQALGLTDFRIDFKRLEHKTQRTTPGMAQTEFAHTIQLPREFSQLMAQIDIKQAPDVESVLKDNAKK